MHSVVIFGGESVIIIHCYTFLEALFERDVRQGMGYTIEIEDGWSHIDGAIYL